MTTSLPPEIAALCIPAHSAQDVHTDSARIERQKDLLETLARIGAGNYRSPRATAPVLSTRVHQLLVAGVDPATLNTEGQDGVQVMLQAANQDDASPTNVVALTALRYMIQHGYPLMDRGALAQMPAALRRDVLRYTATCARKGIPVLDDAGGTACHWLAEHRPAALVDAFSQDAKVPGRSSWCVDPSDATRARTTDGATPLHALWASMPLAGDMPPSAYRAQVNAYRFIARQLIERLHVDAFAPDRQGVRPVDLMASAGAFDISSVEQSTQVQTQDAFFADLHTRMLQQDTARPHPATRSMPRL